MRGGTSVLGLRTTTSPGADVVTARTLRRRMYSRGVLIVVAALFPLAFALGYLTHPNF
jgi:hypothetical protein